MAKCSFEGCEAEHVATVSVAQKAGSPVQYPDVDYPVCEKHHWHVRNGDPYDIKTDALGQGDTSLVLTEADRSS